VTNAAQLPDLLSGADAPVPVSSNRYAMQAPGSR
jgi:hypothetical protein